MYIDTNYSIHSCSTGYGNEERVFLDDLLPSLGREEVEIQKHCAEEDKVSTVLVQ